MTENGTLNRLVSVSDLSPATGLSVQKSSKFGGVRTLSLSQSKKAKDEMEVPASQYTPLDSVLKSKFSTDFVPGRATDLQACKSKAMVAMKNIIVSSKRFKENNTLKEIAAQLHSKLKSDRSSINYNKYD